MNRATDDDEVCKETATAQKGSYKGDIPNDKAVLEIARRQRNQKERFKKKEMERARTAFGAGRRATARHTLRSLVEMKLCIIM